MKTSVRGLILSLGVLLVAGCATPQEARIRERPDVFGSLTPGQRKMVQAGKVRVGFTEDMVYLALGRPEKVDQKPCGTNGNEDWIYSRMAARFVNRPGDPRAQVDTMAFEQSEWIPRPAYPNSDGPYDHDVWLASELHGLKLTFRSGVLVDIRVVG